ncbi:type IV pilus biogenesis protein PilM [Xanthomonas euvesicatoria pv. euvesicatoria]|uniref:type IV pilus biogenesis protein PilM n=2 Tax=Xanthomonas TaxID=338 RepID=UPI00069C05FE|nr:type IV pilus biogenesis protein PilM [Xanthomonas euvesicatoria]MCC8501268.1 type IV pilus biogenesis protein PilM [Xanthomonas euvesicatoria pv. euvesicatoria]MCC8568961.1 type IV pilus biogenesis protein PilM [Xanthomonas euvesicatoria pv. euvesicatoria]MCC8575528.1 type IV pilus biogenesis protein PilM [Xanthomonas euvesicatoria pv. euvesicatoria]MCC8764724.1 type IV pilus biogenesis protein PilM [Xanthomonas euvesicatoria pv. euvesicatoria]MCC8769106.1 type IV pilus biogenesis protein 
MFNIAVTGFFFSLLVTLSMGSAALSQQRAMFGEAAVIAQSIALYGVKVANYRMANTTFSGSVSDSVLNLPAYYVKFPGTGNTISGGRSYIYMAGVERGIRGYVYRNLDKSGATTGYAAGGRLVSAGGADQGTLPAGIPSGSVVLVL